MIIVMIINIIELYIYAVYLYYIYTKINVILVCSNFLGAYHSYLPLKQ